MSKYPIKENKIQYISTITLASSELNELQHYHQISMIQRGRLFIIPGLLAAAEPQAVQIGDHGIV